MLRVAKGICQLCDKEAPIKDKHGQPFLEVHHIHYLSNGGEDKIENVIDYVRIVIGKSTF